MDLGQAYLAVRRAKIEAAMGMREAETILDKALADCYEAERELANALDKAQRARNRVTKATDKLDAFVRAFATMRDLFDELRSAL